MADHTPLSDIEAHERLCAAAEALGSAQGATVRADTALKAARKGDRILEGAEARRVDVDRAKGAVDVAALQALHDAAELSTRHDVLDGLHESLAHHRLKLVEKLVETLPQ